MMNTLLHERIQEWKTTRISDVDITSKKWLDISQAETRRYTLWLTRRYTMWLHQFVIHSYNIIKISYLFGVSSLVFVSCGIYS